MGKRVQKMDQLTNDAISAFSSGMSYGKYMAMKKDRVVETVVETVAEKNTRLISLGYKPCEMCGTLFLPRTNANKTKYCSDECRRLRKLQGDKNRNKTRTEVAMHLNDGYLFDDRNIGGHGLADKDDYYSAIRGVKL